MSDRMEELKELAESDLPGETSDDESAAGSTETAAGSTETAAGSTETAAGSAEAADGVSSRTSTAVDSSTDASTGGDQSSGGLRGRLPSVGLPSVGSGSLFAPRRFLIALVASVAGLVLGGMLPFVGFLTQYAGLFAAAFAYGLLTDEAAYAEVGTGAAVAAAVTLLLGTLAGGGLVVGTDVIGRYGLTITGVGVGIGLLVGVVGHYFGRDLRAGVTRDI